jgi:hypothetical protein
MKKTIIFASVFFATTAAAQTANDIPRAPFAVDVFDVDFNSPDTFGCTLAATANEDKVRLKWIADATIDRQSLVGDEVKAHMKIQLAKIAEKDGVSVYGYREGNAIVLIVPGKDIFNTTTAHGDRMFMTQTCGMGLTLLYTKSLENECDQHFQKEHFPGFCGKLARLDGKVSKDKTFTMTAGLTPTNEIRVLLKTHQNPAP